MFVMDRGSEFVLWSSVAVELWLIAQFVRLARQI